MTRNSSRAAKFSGNGGMRQFQNKKEWGIHLLDLSYNSLSANSQKFVPVTNGEGRQEIKR